MSNIVVVAGVIEVKGRLLVCQRPSDKHHGGMWEFPGGRVLLENSGQQALCLLGIFYYYFRKDSDAYYR